MFDDEGFYCSGDAVTFTAGGRTYAVNGTALGRFPSMPKIDRIWKKNPKAKVNLLGPRVDISPIIDRGLKLCGD